LQEDDEQEQYISDFQYRLAEYLDDDTVEASEIARFATSDGGMVVRYEVELPHDTAIYLQLDAKSNTPAVAALGVQGVGIDGPPPPSGACVFVVSMTIMYFSAFMMLFV
jgi:hypothetical protein